MQQLLGPVLCGPQLEQLRVLVDELRVHGARQELLVVEHILQEGDVGLQDRGGWGGVTMQRGWGRRSSSRWQPGQHSFPSSPDTACLHWHFPISSPPPRFWQSPPSCQGAKPASSLLAHPRSYADSHLRLPRGSENKHLHICHSTGNGLGLSHSTTA